MITLVLELPEAFAKALAAKHPGGLDAAAAVALKAYVTGGRPQINKERDTAIIERIKSGARRADIAKEFEISLVRVNQIAAEHGDLAGYSRASLNAERDRAIVEHLKDGKRYAEVAATFGLSITRVSQLAALNGITNNRPSQVERQRKLEQRNVDQALKERLLREWAGD